MTKYERKQLEKAISHLMAENESDGFTTGMDILLALVGKKQYPKEGESTPIWGLGKKSKNFEECLQISIRENRKKVYLDSK